MWFLIVYATLAIASRLNDRTTFVLCKILVSGGLVAWFMKQEWLLENIFDLLERVFRIHWSSREWAFRVNLDLWIVYAGMLAAIANMKLREYRLTEDLRWPLVSKFAFCASAVCMMWFFGFELYQESKFTYNLWHPYMSFLPILAFIVLRNASVILRSGSSSAFAFIGKCSLETFIIQYHFWLAGDTRGVLLVLPGTRWRPVNFVVTTVMFIFVSDQMARATTQITSWICGTTSKSLPLPAMASSSNTGPTSSSRPNTSSAPEGTTGHDTIISIPLLTPSNDNTHKEGESSSPLTSEPGTPRRTNRWVDRLAEGSPQPSRTPGFRIWSEESVEGYGVKTRLIIGFGLMWIVNILWPN